MMDLLGRVYLLTDTHGLLDMTIESRWSSGVALKDTLRTLLGHRTIDHLTLGLTLPLPHHHRPSQELPHTRLTQRTLHLGQSHGHLFLVGLHLGVVVVYFQTEFRRVQLPDVLVGLGVSLELVNDLV